MRHVRWRPAAGRLEHFFDDQPVPGTKGLAPDLLRRVEPFPTRELVPYDTAYLSGFVVEHYQVVLVDAAAQSRLAMDEALRRLCAAEVPGDTYRDLRVSNHIDDVRWKHVLLPMWTLSYDFRGKTYNVLVHGQTAKVVGKAPWSWLKIALAVLAVPVLAGLVLLVLAAFGGTVALFA